MQFLLSSIITHLSSAGSSSAHSQAIVCNNENVIREYQARQAQIDEITEEVRQQDA